MSIEFLTKELSNLGTAHRDNRKRVADIVVNDITLIPHLISITFKTNDKLSIKAAWVLEWMCTHYDLELLLPYLNEFTSNIKHLKFDSAIRPCAKICEHLANAFYAKKDNKVKQMLKPEHIEAIVSTGFDWLITPQKIAVRAYTMNTLYLFGLDESWIHPELQHLIETKIIHESKGTKARGKHILQLIQASKK